MVLVRSPRPDVAIPDARDLHSAVFVHSPFLSNPAQQRAVVDAITGETWTFRELEQRVEDLAAGLLARGVRAGDVIGLSSFNCLDYVTLVFAVARIGATLTPANPTYVAKELHFQLTDSGARFLFASAEVFDVAKNAVQNSKVEEIFVIGRKDVPGHKSVKDISIRKTVPKTKYDFNKALFLCYSSGTTGTPKGVELTHRNIIANVLQISDFEGDNVLRTDIWCTVLPLYHVYGLVVLLCCGAYLGLPQIMLPRFDLAAFLQAIQDYKITTTHIVPPVIIHLSKNPLVDKYNLRSLRQIISGAAPLDPVTEESVQKRLKCTVRQAYGMTELSPASHISTPNMPGSVGYLLCNQVAKIVDPANGKELGYGQEGEIWIKGPNVMKGYLNRPDATAETVDTDGFLHTGDVGKADEQGRFVITDRLKELIKYKGFQVAPAELEGILLGHPLVADVAVIPIPDEIGGEVPKAYVVLKPDSAGSAGSLGPELVKYVEGRVAPHKQLRGGVQFIDAIPKSPSGKILRRHLKDLEKAKKSKL